MEMKDRLSKMENIFALMMTNVEKIASDMNMIKQTSKDKDKDTKESKE